LVEGVRAALEDYQEVVLGTTRVEEAGHQDI
jgi:hypothetical protein